MTKTVTPAAMTVAAGVVTAAGIEQLLRTATTVEGFFTGLLGLFAAVCAAIYWKRKVVNAKEQRSERRKGL